MNATGPRKWMRCPHRARKDGLCKKHRLSGGTIPDEWTPDDLPVFYVAAT
jgi:hypothetical protein